MKHLFLTAASLSLLACSPSVMAHDGGGSSDNRAMITVSATGMSSQTPDIASVSAGVVTEGKTAGQAMQANANLMSAVFKELQAAGLPPKNVQTSQLSLQPRYNYENNKAPVITGYEARNTVSAKSEDLDAVGPMLDALVRAGVNTINGVEFSVKDPTIGKAKALESAIKEAKEKAEFMARAAGVRLGKLQSLSESTGGNYYPQPMMMARTEMASDIANTQISAGEQSLSVTVNLVYAIVD